MRHLPDPFLPSNANMKSTVTRASSPVIRIASLAALALCLMVSACGDEDFKGQSTLAPVEIDRSTSCDLDGMLLADYPGPKAQIHYVGQEHPVFYCDVIELFNALLEGEQVRTIRGAYVQDMGKADWDNPQGHWIEVKTAYYVVGSKRHGSMGPTFASFLQEADAQEFVKEYGGKVQRFDDISVDKVDLTGGALHDERM